MRKYLRAFELLGATLEDVPEHVQESTFINGLRPEIKAEIRMLKPKGLREVMNFAQHVEERNTYSWRERRITRPPLSGPNQPLNHGPNLPTSPFGFKPPLNNLPTVGFSAHPNLNPHFNAPPSPKSNPRPVPLHDPQFPSIPKSQFSSSQHHPRAAKSLSIGSLLMLILRKN